MSNTTLSSIALDVVGQYRQAGQHIVRAYRGGGERFLRGLNAQGPKLFGALDVRNQVADLAIRGLDTATGTAGRAIDQLAQGAAIGIERIGGTTDRLQAKLDAAGLEMVSALQRKAASASLELAGKVSQLSQRLSDRIVGAPTSKPVATPARKARAVKKTARRTKRAA